MSAGYCNALWDSALTLISLKLLHIYRRTAELHPSILIWGFGDTVTAFGFKSSDDAHNIVGEMSGGKWKTYDRIRDLLNNLRG